jgi:hypothetical protein
VDQDFGTGDIDKGATSEAENERADNDGGVLDTDTDSDAGRLNQRKAEEN